MGLVSRFARFAGFAGFAGFAAIALAAAPRQSAPDKVMLDDFFKTCAQPIATAKATMAAAGEKVSDAEFEGWLRAQPAQFREGAKFEQRTPDAAYLRDTIAQVRKAAADPDDKDPTTKFMAPIFICMLETMLRHEAGGGASDPAPAPAAPRVPEPHTPAMIVARTVCFDEVAAFEAEYANETGASDAGARELNELLLPRFVPANSDRAALLKLGKDVIQPNAGPLQRARGVLMLCLANVGVAVDSGARAIDVLRERWASARANLGPVASAASRPAPPAPAPDLAPPSPAPAPPPAPRPAPSPAAPASPVSADSYSMRVARTACGAEIKGFTDAHVQAGSTNESATRAIDDILQTFLTDPEPREQVLRDFDAMARGVRETRDAVRLSLSTCAASVGQLFSMGMRNTNEFTGFWNGRGKARFAIPGFDTKADAAGCVWLEWDAPNGNSPLTIRNLCNFTVDMRFCAVQAQAGSATESIACDKGLSRFERLEANGSVRSPLGFARSLSWVQCKAPLQPVQTSAPGTAFAASCK